MYQVIIIFHVLFGLAIIGLVLMQQGRGADAGAAFGSGASGSVFGAQGSASFLSRATAIFAALFFVTSLTLTVLSSDGGVIKDLFAEEDEALVSDLPPAAEEVTDGVPVIDEVPGVSDEIENVTPIVPESEAVIAPVEESVSVEDVEEAVATDAVVEETEAN